MALATEPASAVPVLPRCVAFSLAYTRTIAASSKSPTKRLVIAILWWGMGRVEIWAEFKTRAAFAECAIAEGALAHFQQAVHHGEVVVTSSPAPEPGPPIRGRMH